MPLSLLDPSNIWSADQPSLQSLASSSVPIPQPGYQDWSFSSWPLSSFDDGQGHHGDTSGQSLGPYLQQSVSPVTESHNSTAQWPASSYFAPLESWASELVPAPTAGPATAYVPPHLPYPLQPETSYVAQTIPSPMVATQPQLAVQGTFETQI